MYKRISLTIFIYLSILFCLILVSCSTIPLKYKIITSLTNIDYNSANKYLLEIEKKYDNLNTSQKCDYHYLYGCYYYANLMYEKAEKEYNNCLELNRDYVQALYSRAQLRSTYLDDFKGAVEDFEKIIKILNYAEETELVGNNSLITLYVIAIEPVDSKFFGKTSRFKSTTSNNNELKLFCYNQLVDTCFKFEQYKETIRYIYEIEEFAKTNQPKSVHRKKILAECYFKLGEYRNAVNAFTKYSASVPESYYPYYRIGVCYFFLEDYKNCVDQLNISKKKMSKIDFTEIDNYTEQENNEIITTRHKIAKKEYSEILESLLFYRARSLGKLKMYSEAIADLTSILETNSEYLDALYYRAYFKNYAGNQQSALHDYLEVIRLDPDRNTVNYSIAVIYDSMGNFDLAIKFYTDFTSKEKNTTSQKYQAAISRLKKLKS